MRFCTLRARRISCSDQLGLCESAAVFGWVFAQSNESLYGVLHGEAMRYVKYVKRFSECGSLVGRDKYSAEIQSRCTTPDIETYEIGDANHDALIESVTDRFCEIFVIKEIAK